MISACFLVAAISKAELITKSSLFPEFTATTKSVRGSVYGTAKI